MDTVYFFWWDWLGFELLSFVLVKPLLATPPVHFALVVLEMGSLMNYLASNTDPPDFSLPSS
jgi:hypothetical protein